MNCDLGSLRCFFNKYSSFYDFSLPCTDWSTPATGTAKQPSNMSKPLPYFIGRISFDLSLKIFFCGHEADATYQKALILFFSVQRIFSQKQCGLSACIWTNSWAFFMFLFQKWGLVPWSPFSFRKPWEVCLHCCTFILEVIVYLFWSLPWFFLHQLNSTCSQAVVG